MHPERRAWTQIPSDDDQSYSEASSDSSSDDSSSDEEPPAKTRTRRSNEPLCAADKTTPESSGTEPFQSMMKESFNNVVLSDITIFLRGLRFPAHSFVLAAQCNYFKDALTKGRLKNEAVKEFRYEQCQPHAYWRMFEYLYKGTYSIGPVPDITEPDDELLHRHIRVYAVAKAFGIESLQLIYEITKAENNMLRKEMMEIVAQHGKSLWKIGAFQALVRNGRDFALELTAKLLERD